MMEEEEKRREAATQQLGAKHAAQLEEVQQQRAKLARELEEARAANSSLVEELAEKEEDLRLTVEENDQLQVIMPPPLPHRLRASCFPCPLLPPSPCLASPRHARMLA